jgi:hypothetical protein
VENTALGNEALDVSSETVQALGVLHEMALAMGDHSTAAWAAQHQQAMLAAFHQWWISGQHLYADSMCEGTEGDCTHAGQQLQQRWWTTVAPMEQGIAPAANADAALAKMEGPAFTGTCGLFVDGVGGPSGTGGQTCYLVNTGAMARAEANYGRTAQAVAYMDKVASQLTVEMPGSLPELAASAQYNPFEAFTSRANVMQAWCSYGVMQAWCSYGVMWTVVNDLLGVTPDGGAGQGPGGGADAGRAEGRVSPDRGLPDPELVDEQGPEGVELVVPDSCGQHDQGARVVQRNPGRLVGQFAVDPRPEVPGSVGTTRFERAGPCHLGVDQPVAELAVVDVGRIAREEGAAGEQRADEV